ncbi:LacI family DNA-binding transcriptional regulator [Mucilaginibacter sp. X5P1]|uniref:LacI family DNA-binding transcriptional regulator n=1 Tax=Mucilaginibacter sp. X5P1 TaxID=2723088 RepID=UPI001614D111|nr:LacI family DNA-binding transcriptional regulator [Mucilaginibacter sp. X5P1]MBB6136620.1 LacI family transcriptional regulator [Mucilaginibacter sp. X5P1]
MTKKPTTLKEIAKALNISVSTVSRGLQDHSSIGMVTKMRIKQRARELNYEPNQTAISFKKGKSFNIGVILPELSESFFSAAVNGIEDTADKRNYTVLLAQSHDSEEIERTLVAKMKNQRVDGMLISVTKNTSAYDHFETLRKSNIPIVFFDRIPSMKDIHSVACNMATGTFEAVNFLLKRGHRVIGMINGPSTLYATGERKDGYIQALIKNRLKFDPSLLVNCDLTETGTIAAMKELLNNKRRPTAIVTFNDYVALFAIRYARSQNIEINKELTFVSYANLPLINYMDYVPAASVEQFPYLQGQKATDILIDLLNSPTTKEEGKQAYYNIKVESQLVINNKVKP